MNPEAAMGILQNPTLEEIARDVGAALRRAVLATVA
jgi:hypothetical protein